MAEGSKNQAWRGPQALAGSLGAVLAPIIAKRGFAAADLLGAWPEIVGPRYADCTQPEHIGWDRAGTDPAGILTLRVEGPKAIYLQHETGEIIQRINGFLG